MGPLQRHNLLVITPTMHTVSKAILPEKLLCVQLLGHLNVFFLYDNPRLEPRVHLRSVLIPRDHPHIQHSEVERSERGSEVRSRLLMS